MVAPSRSSATKTLTTQCVGASVTSAKETREVDAQRLQHCRHRGANKDGHSSLLLKPGFIQVHVYTSPKTHREVRS